MSQANAAFRLLPLLAALLCQAAAAQGTATQADAQRISQQLREAIDRANAQRPAPASPPRNRPAAPAPTPSVSVNIGQGGAMSLTPTLPSAPAPAGPQAAAQAPAQPPARPATRAPAAPGVADDEVAPPPRAAAAAPAPARSAPQGRRWSEGEVQRQYERARAIAHGQAIPAQARLPRDAATPVAARSSSAKPQPLPSTWSYSGPGGPQAWAVLKPEYELCGSGQRQSPIHIETTATLQGPNEALAFDYRAGSGKVVHDGRTIRVDVQGEHLLAVRGASWRLEQILFRHPAEEKIDHQGFAMGVHLVHRNAQGQLAIVAVLLQPGEPSAFIDRVWTYLPLDVDDAVQMPADWLQPATLLPEDQRYYQFFGSLTQPPCTEGVLWMVLKQPVTLSPAQLRLFAQMFPANARPVQALNGRIVREAH